MANDRRPTTSGALPIQWEVITTAEFQTGVTLFNAGHFWEAHEAWETLWLRATEPERTLIQGLIQLAAALVHWQRGNRRGLVANWYKARPKLVAVWNMRSGWNFFPTVAAMDVFTCGTEPASVPQLPQ